MRLIVAGSRGATSYSEVATAIGKVVSEWCELPEAVISGTARGVDRLGEQWAEDNAVPVERFPADWDRRGRAAGRIRNREMAKHADALIAVWDGESRGTANMILEAHRAGLKVYVHLVKP